MPLCAARFYIFESAFFLIFEVRLFSARGDAHIERFIFSLPAYRLAFRLAVRSPRVFAFVCAHPRRRFCPSKNFSFYVLPPAFFILQKSSRCFLFAGKREISLPFSERFSETGSAC